MCKIAVMSGITDETTADAWKFIKKLGVEMSSGSEKDGFGYSAIDGEGKMFGERWLNNSDIFEKIDLDKKMLKRYKGFVKAKEVVHNSFGEVHENSLRSFTLHARHATSERAFKNTHPFVIGDTSLIHNGVISNVDELDLKISTCDSETILNEYIKHNVMNNVKSIQKVADHLQGYYACGVFSKTSEGLLILDLFKDNTAKVKAYYIKEFDSVVFATPGFTDYNDPVKSTCKALGLTVVADWEIEGGRLLRMDALTGNTIDKITFDPTYLEKNNIKDFVKKTWNERFPTRSSKNYHGYDSRHEVCQPKETEADKEADIAAMLEESILNLEKTSKVGYVSKFAKDELERDFVKDGNGTWHRKGTGTDRS